MGISFVTREYSARAAKLREAASFAASKYGDSIDTAA
jgi:hypothetical protein